MCECGEVCLKDLEDKCLECCQNMGEPDEIWVPEDCVVTCMKVEDNNIDSLPIGHVCDLIDGLIPPGFKPLEEVEFFITSDDNPPEFCFWETLKLLFSRKGTLCD